MYLDKSRFFWFNVELQKLDKQENGMKYISILWLLGEMCNRGCKRCLSRSINIGQQMTTDQVCEVLLAYNDARDRDLLAAGFFTVSGFGEPLMYQNIYGFTQANVGMVPVFSIVTSGAETDEEELRMSNISELMKDAQRGVFMGGTDHEMTGRSRIASFSLTLDETERSQRRFLRSIKHLPSRSQVQFVVDDPEAEIDHMAGLFRLYDDLLEHGFLPASLYTPYNTPEEKIHWQQRHLSLGSFRNPDEFVTEMMDGREVFFRNNEQSLMASFNYIQPFGRAIDNFPYLHPSKLCCSLDSESSFTRIVASHKGLALCPHANRWSSYSDLVSLANSAQGIMDKAREQVMKQYESWNTLRCLCEICPLRMAYT